MSELWTGCPNIRCSWFRIDRASGEAGPAEEETNQTTRLERPYAGHHSTEISHNFGSSESEIFAKSRSVLVVSVGSNTLSFAYQINYQQKSAIFYEISRNATLRN